MYVQVLGATYYLISFLDEYSRMIVHGELLPDMGAHSVSLAAQAAIERLPRAADGRPRVTPEIRSDNGSGYVSAEFRSVLRENGLGHHRIRPHCPEENGLIERAYRTLREELDGDTLETYWQARDALAKVIHRYNHERLHSALGYLRPIDCGGAGPRPISVAAPSQNGRHVRQHLPGRGTAGFVA
jgi:transposase InsO family protein